MNNKVSIIKIKDLFDAEEVLSILEMKKIPIVNTCDCIFSIYSGYFHFKSRPICRDGHIILVPKRYYELALEIVRSVEEGLPILY
jgi:hypothetical protein